MATWPTTVDDNGTGTTGTIIDDAYLDAVRGYIGETWTSVAHGSLSFLANVGTWTVESGDLSSYRYIVCGKTCTVTFAIQGSSISNATSLIAVSVPPGLTGSGLMLNAIACVNNGSVLNGVYAQMNSGVDAGLIYFARVDGGNFAAGTNNNTFYGQITFQIT